MPRSLFLTLRLLPILLVLVMSVGTVACTANRKPLFDSSSGESAAFRRYTKRPQVDYLFRWNRQAFRRLEGEIDTIQTDDVRAVLDRHGRPDYVRHGVRGIRNEYFDEWVWWDSGVIVQFITGRLVYEGELMDTDRVLVEYGFPSSAWAQQLEIGPRRETWIYDDLFEIGNRTYSFTDGKLVYQSQQ